MKRLSVGRLVLVGTARGVRHVTPAAARGFDLALERGWRLVLRAVLLVTGTWASILAESRTARWSLGVYAALMLAGTWRAIWPWSAVSLAFLASLGLLFGLVGERDIRQLRADSLRRSGGDAATTATANGGPIETSPVQ